MALYIIFGAMLWAWHPPGLSVADDKAEDVARINPALSAERA
jgi:hypothetical protein